MITKISVPKAGGLVDYEVGEQVGEQVEVRVRHPLIGAWETRVTADREALVAGLVEMAKGALIQDALRGVSAEDREALITPPGGWELGGAGLEKVLSLAAMARAKPVCVSSLRLAASGDEENLDPRVFTVLKGGKIGVKATAMWDDIMTALIGAAENFEAGGAVSNPATGVKVGLTENYTVRMTVGGKFIDEVGTDATPPGAYRSGLPAPAWAEGHVTLGLLDEAECDEGDPDTFGVDHERACVITREQLKAAREMESSELAETMEAKLADALMDAYVPACPSWDEQGDWVGDFLYTGRGVLVRRGSEAERIAEAWALRAGLVVVKH